MPHPLLVQADQNIQNSDAPQSIKEASTKALKETKLILSSRLTTTAGMACAKMNPTTLKLDNFKIKISNYIFAHSNQEERFETFSHEFAHIVDMIAHNFNHKHSYVWKRIHQWAGGTASRTHNLPVKKKTVKRVILFHYPSQSVKYATIQEFKKRCKYDWFIQDYSPSGIAYFQGSKLVKNISRKMTINETLMAI